MTNKLLSRRTMILYSVANAGTNMVAAFTNAALPLFLLPYGLPGWLVGLLAQERSGVGGVVQPLIGWLSDRTSTRLGKRRPYFLVGAPLTAVSLVVLALHPPLGVSLALISILALLLAVANDPYTALMADITPASQRGRLGGVMAIFGMGGQVLMLLAAALLWDSHQFLVTGGVAVGLVVCFGITFFGVREPASGSEGQDTPGALAISGASPAGSSSSVRGTGEILPTLVVGEAPAAHADLSASHFAETPAGLKTASAPGPCLGPEPGQRSIHPRLAPLGYLRGVLGYREVVKYSLAMTCFWLGTGGASPFLTRFGVQELGMSEGGAFILMLVLVSCAGLCAYPAGLLGDRFGKKPVMTVGLAFFAVAILAGSQAHSTGQIIPAIVFIGIGSTVPLVLNFPMLVDLIPVGRAGEFVGLGSMLWSIGQPLGALLGGTIADLTGGYWLTFVFAGLTILTALALLQTVHAQVTRPVPAPTGAALQPAS